MTTIDVSPVDPPTEQEELLEWIGQVEEWAAHVHDNTLSVYKLEERLDQLASYLRTLDL